MINSKTLIFSIIAGLASAVLAALALTRPGLMSLLIYMTAVPVFFASFAWGPAAGFIAATVAIVSVAVTGDLAVSAIVGITLSGPAAIIGYMSGQSRTGNDGAVYWFPLSGILFRLTLIIGAAYFFLGLWLGFDITKVAVQFEHFMRQVVDSQNTPLTTIQEQALKRNAAFYASLLPLIVPAFNLLILVWNMSIAQKLVRKYSTMRRPKDNIAADVGLPSVVLMIFAASLVVALFVPSLQSIAYVVLGTTSMAISMIGLAVVHYYLWGVRARRQLLFFTYVVLIVFSLPIVLVLVVGIVELLFYLRARDPNRMPPS